MFEVQGLSAYTTLAEMLGTPEERSEVPRIEAQAQLIRVTEGYYQNLSPEIREALVPYLHARSTTLRVRWFVHSLAVERLLEMETW